MFGKKNTGLLNIEGMTCVHCQKRVADTLSAVKGVKKVEVNLEQKNAEVIFLEDKVDLDQLKAAVENVGYTVTKVQLL